MDEMHGWPPYLILSSLDSWLGGDSQCGIRHFGKDLGSASGQEGELVFQASRGQDGDCATEVKNFSADAGKAITNLR